uniref:WD repeat-containing protein 18-like n=1 Tax=Phallusia mammillata TaxID=59560 RepID=A0A6F9DXJ1_9ASCI|nr:WD repeat-containing protein 18-like [Phallusia mammillata]
MELLVCSEVCESGNGVSSIHFMDLGTAQTLFSFKTAHCPSNGMCLVKADYILHAVSNKSFLQVFEVTRTGHQPKKIVTPGVVKALDASHDGTLIAAGIEEKVLLWDAQNGELLCILSKHYQDVTCLKFTDDCGILSTGGADGIVVAWDVSDLLDNNSSDGDREPIASFVAHTLPVTGIACSLSSVNQPRLYTSSQDRTVKIHDLLLGQTLLSIVYDTGITSLVIDNAESVLCVGGMNGNVYKLDLISICHKRKTENEIDITTSAYWETSHTLKGHVNPITAISFSMDCSQLVTCAKNEGLLIWDIFSGQCVKTIKCSSVSSNGGKITNILILPTPESLHMSVTKPIVNFPKLAHATKSSDQTDCKALFKINCSSSINPPITSIDNYLSCSHKTCKGDAIKASALSEEVNRLRHENKRLYDFAVNKIVSGQ